MNDFFFSMNEKEEYKQVVEAVKEGNKEAKTKLARYLLSGYGGVQIDEDRAFDILKERVAKDEDAEAMWMLGLCYEYGMGCDKKDEAEAQKLYEQAADKQSLVGKFLMKHQNRFADEKNHHIIALHDLSEHSSHKFINPNKVSCLFFL